jgi:disulfide bond formation protein DsbB
MPPAARHRRFLPLIAVWLAFVSLPPLGLWAARDRLLAWQSSPASQAEWDTFRDAMQAESEGRGPVKRKVPKSPEPPLKVWLRDYFPLAIVAWVLFGSVLYFVTAFLLMGAAVTTRRKPSI